MFDKASQQYIKDLILKGLEFASYPPTFEQDLFFYQKYKDFNCYAYAMQFSTLVQAIDALHIGEVIDPYIYNVGCLSTRQIKPPQYTKRNIYSYFEGDCNYLGINYDATSIDSPALPDAYKVAIFTQYIKEYPFGFDFHFIRQNADLSWSQIPCIDEKPELIDISKDLKDYEFIKCVRIRKPNL